MSLTFFETSTVHQAVVSLLAVTGFRIFDGAFRRISLLYVFIFVLMLVMQE